MIVLRKLGILAFATLAIAASVVDATAQITTGNITVENITFYKVLDEKRTHAFDFVRIEQTAGSFFKSGTTLKCLELWAGQAKAGILSSAESDQLLKAWETVL